MEPYHYTNYYTTTYFHFFPPLMTRIRGKSQTPQKMHHGEEIERKKERNESERPDDEARDKYSSSRAIILAIGLMARLVKDI